MFCLLCVLAHVHCFFHFFHTAYLCLEVSSNIWILLMIPVSIIMSLKYPGHLLNIHEVYWYVGLLSQPLFCQNDKMERNCTVVKFWPPLCNREVTNPVFIVWCQPLFAVSISFFSPGSLYICTLLHNTRVPHYYWNSPLEC